MKFLILSTDPSILKWKSLAAKKKTYLDTLNSGKNAKWETVDVIYTPAKPLVLNKKIDHSWLFNLNKPFFSQGYDMIAFHTSMKQWRDWGIEGSLRGANPNSKREQEDMYFSADEHTRRNGLNRFEQTGIHEASHGYYDHSGENDLTHTWHDKNPDISGLFKTFDWSKYQPARMALRKEKNRLESLVASLKARLANKPVIDTKLPVNDLLPLVKRKSDAIVAEMKRLGHEVRLVQGFRSIQEQNKLYAQGRTTPGAIVTNARGGESFHNYGVAVDFVFRREGYNATESLWQLLGKVGKAQGFSWGGDWKGFKDRPHFELILDYKLADFQNGKVNYNNYV